jgi:hypothetical protein
VNTTNSSLKKISGWRILGRLAVPVETTRELTLQSWLAQLGVPCLLQTHFLQKLSNSMQKAISRHIAQAGTKCKFICLIVYVPDKRLTTTGTCSFFRIERTEREKNDPAHSIEFYLYMEE